MQRRFSTTQALSARALGYQPVGEPQVRVTALGGGHGLYGSLSALRYVTTDLTAVVTVADDGGSSGRLRRDFDVIPPGDLRMALSALCDDTDWGRTWRDVMQHRFAPTGAHASSELDQHALGNLLIVALWQLLDDPIAGLDWAGALLNARGRVLPMSKTPLIVSGDSIIVNGNGVETCSRVSGQARLGKSHRVENIEISPLDAPACEESVEAIMEADWVILGPGSWYTSVIPHLLLPGIRDALINTPAKKCVVMNLDLNGRETAGLTAGEHLRILHKYAPELRLNAVIADVEGMGSHSDLQDAAAELGAIVTWSPLRDAQQENVHDALKLAAAYRGVFQTVS